MRDYGLDIAFRGDVAVLSFDGVELQRTWKWVSSHTSTSELDWPWPTGRLLLAERISPTQAKVARKRGDWYADAAGRVHVRAPGVFIDVRDRPAAVKRSDTVGSVSRNPMSPSRAQVVCLLLDRPALIGEPVRSIAGQSGVSAGVAQQVLSDLEARRFLRHGRTRLNRVDELLDQWSAAFGSGLGPRLELGRFRGDAVQLGGWLKRNHVVYLSGEAASDELHGTDATIYVAELDRTAVIASRWEPNGERPNIIVRRQFWSDPGREAGVHLALLPLQLADLLVRDDPRLRLAARSLREQILDLHAR